MKNLIKKAVDDLKGLSGNDEKIITVYHRAKLQNKFFSGEITRSKDRIIQLHINEIKGYNPSYIKRTVNSAFKAALLPYPIAGSIVWTKYDEEFTVGEDYTLARGSYYFGIGINTYLTCDGRTFFTDAKARFVKKETGSCMPGSGREYQLFEIIRL